MYSSVGVNPFFSVVIPTYNRANFIKQTLDSVLSQTFENLEVIVVDDGSTDNTFEVVAECRDNRLFYFAKANGERGAARNYGIKKSKGSYVIFLDSDDCIHSEHLSILHSKIVELKNINFIATKYNFLRDDTIRASGLESMREGYYSLDDFVDGNFIACNLCIKKDNPNLHLFEEDRRYAAVEDWMFILENTQSDRLYLVDAVTITMNDHDQRSMRADNEALIRRMELAGQWMQQRLKLSNEQQRRLLGRVYYLCAIHAYADGRRGPALRYARQAAPGLSFKARMLLLARIVVGPRIVGLLKG